MNNYVVATIKDWNIKEFEKQHKNIEGNWTLINCHKQLTLEYLRKVSPKYIFFPHWSWIVPNEILDEFKCICFHMTDVPYGRGGSPLQNLIALGHNKTKLTALEMTPKIDAGPIYLKAPLSLEGSAQNIFERAAKLTFEMIETIIKLNPIPIEQKGEPTYFSRRTPEQSQIKGTEKLSDLYNLIRMLDAESYPRAYLNYDTFKLTFKNAHLISNKTKNDPNTDSDQLLSAEVCIIKRDIENNEQ